MKFYISICILILLSTIPVTIKGQEKDSIRRAREEDRKDWNNTLINSNLFTRERNSFLMEAIRNLSPGKALDVAMGEGRNTLLLARNGWETTGFDIADVAMDSARARAERENLKITTIVASRDEFDFGTDSQVYDRS